jgi:bacteriocin-like protein
MKTIQQNQFRTLNAKELNEVKGGYFVIIVTPDGRRYKIWV